MRLDLVLPNEGDYMVEAMNSGPHYEAMGWDGLWLSDHLLGIPEDHIHADDWLDILISMAHLAAQTTRIRIGSGVLILPYRNPVLTARMVASLDQLSGGRIDFGVGVGWLIRESRALGVGDVYDERGPYSNEILDVILTCWKGGTVQFKGRWFDIPPVIFDPVPVQEGGRVPLWVGSLRTTGAPIARVAKYADYWHPSETNTENVPITPERYRETGERLNELAGREIPRTVRINCVGDFREKIDLLHGFAEVGCVQAACSFFPYPGLGQGKSRWGTFEDFDREATRFFELAASLRDV
jgi:alkanesulfonate monooxygenase SsuD/methylene tetrahydromethanopterin reductase-like flavin-dependent oxidoreductase (luciferase family)